MKEDRSRRSISSALRDLAAVMTPTQWGLSIFFLAFFALKAAEGAFQLESWPLSDVSMFQTRRPPEHLPRIARMYGVIGTEWRELSPGDFGLDEDAFVMRLRRSPDLRVSCGNLARIYDERRVIRARRLKEARAVVIKLARPGTGRPDTLIEAECPLAAPAEVCPWPARSTRRLPS